MTSIKAFHYTDLKYQLDEKDIVSSPPFLLNCPVSLSFLSFLYHAWTPKRNGGISQGRENQI